MDGLGDLPALLSKLKDIGKKTVIARKKMDVANRVRERLEKLPTKQQIGVIFVYSNVAAEFSSLAGTAAVGRFNLKG